MGGGRTQKAFLPTLPASLLVAALLASPAAAHGPEDGPIYKSQEGPAHELYANGSIIVGGDAASSCNSVLETSRETGEKRPPRDTYRQVGICERRAFPFRTASLFPRRAASSCRSSRRRD